MVASVDQQPGQGVGVQLHVPDAARPLAHLHVRHDRLRRLPAESRARPGRQRPQLGEHVLEIFGVDAAGFAQRRHVVARQQLEVVEQRRHGRVEAVLLLELQAQAFAHVAGEHSGGLEPLQLDQHLHHPLDAASQPLGQVDQVGAQVAAFIHAVDQHHGDGAFGVGQVGDGQLVVQVVGQGLLAGQRAFDLLAREVHAAAAAGLGPVDAAAGLARGPVVLFVLGAFAGRGVAVEIVTRDIQIAGVGGVGSLGPGLLLALAATLLGRSVGRLVARQQRIALQLALDVGVQLHVRQLQQLDRLLQLRRDDEALPLPELQSCAERHAPKPRLAQILRSA